MTIEKMSSLAIAAAEGCVLYRRTNAMKARSKTTLSADELLRRGGKELKRTKLAAEVVFDGQVDAPIGTRYRTPSGRIAIKKKKMSRQGKYTLIYVDDGSIVELDPELLEKMP